MFSEDISAYLPNHIQPLARQLTQFPLGFEKWVYAPAFSADPYQGDVFVPLPSVVIGDNGDILRADLPEMLISATCDCQRNQGEYLLVAPVVDLEDYRANSELKGAELEDHIRALMDNKISQLIYLPRGFGLQPSFVDLARICPISVRYFHADNPPKRKLVSLSQYGLYFLLVKVAHHFTRLEAQDSRRTAPPLEDS